MDMLELIKSRRSTRKFLSRPVEEEKIDAIIEAGRYAPSGGNNQCRGTGYLRKAG
ncbi:nitroreductase family protein [Intestinimonas butyriciproducens]|uniref:nitroreductase family protein n=1 Tax=Intestinimonas butyriciproducens TaxID=1297617 RepID=UPI0034A53139